MVHSKDWGGGWGWQCLLLEPNFFVPQFPHLHSGDRRRFLF